MTKRLISFVLMLLILATSSLAFAEEWVQEPVGHYGAHMPYRPSDNYNCDQNPPDFSWPAIEGALTYEVKVTTDIARENVVFEAKDIPYNVYNFSKAFDPGIYYWSLRYKTADGYSSWNDVGRFRVDKNAFSHCFAVISKLSKRRVKTNAQTSPTADSTRELLGTQFFKPNSPTEQSLLSRNIIISIKCSILT